MRGEPISFDEWKEILSRNDPDEQNFIVSKGVMPVAWLRVNGLENLNIAWLSMLIVCDKFQRQGIGAFAVNYAEDFVEAINAFSLRTLRKVRTCIHRLKRRVCERIFVAARKREPPCTQRVHKGCADACAEDAELYAYLYRKPLTNPNERQSRLLELIEARGISEHSADERGNGLARQGDYARSAPLAGGVSRV